MYVKALVFDFTPQCGRFARIVKLQRRDIVARSADKALYGGRK
jgi:hypothetical protein